VVLPSRRGDLLVETVLARAVEFPPLASNQLEQAIELSRGRTRTALACLRDRVEPVVDGRVACGIAGLAKALGVRPSTKRILVLGGRILVVASTHGGPPPCRRAGGQGKTQQQQANPCAFDAHIPMDAVLGSRLLGDLRGGR
jgi:hypothetical protein